MAMKEVSANASATPVVTLPRSDGVPDPEHGLTAGAAEGRPISAPCPPEQHQR